MRTRTSFQKRQKEIARMEKQRDKAAKRMQRKLEGPKPDADALPEDALPEDALPEDGAPEDGAPVEADEPVPENQ